MTGHFEKGEWIDSDIILFDKYAGFEDIELLAKELGVKPLSASTKPENVGITIQGISGNAYSLADIMFAHIHLMRTTLKRVVDGSINNCHQNP